VESADRHCQGGGRLALFLFETNTIPAALNWRAVRWSLSPQGANTEPGWKPALRPCSGQVPEHAFSMFLIRGAVERARILPSVGAGLTKRTICGIIWGELADHLASRLGTSQYPTN
jgi:hypothetical protein